MLMTQDVRHSSTREFDATFQFYQASLLVARSEGKLLQTAELEVFHPSFRSFNSSDWWFVLCIGQNNVRNA